MGIYPSNRNPYGMTYDIRPYPNPGRMTWDYGPDPNPDGMTGHIGPCVNPGSRTGVYHRIYVTSGVMDFCLRRSRDRTANGPCGVSLSVSRTDSS